MLTTSVIKALDTALVVTAFTILYIYIPTLIHILTPHLPSGTDYRNCKHLAVDIYRMFRNSQVPKSAFLMCGIIVTWIGALVVYSDISIKLWSNIDAAAVGSASTATRLFYLILFLIGGAVHIAAAQRERYGILRAFTGWTLAVAVLIFTLIVIDCTWKACL